MKRLFCLSLALMLGLPIAALATMRAGAIAPPADAQNATVAFQASFGYLTGQAKEHVYDYDGPGGSRRQLSRLDWDLDGVFMGGINASLRILERLTFNAGFWIPLTEGNGQMEDYDWLDETSSQHTHYSLSDVDVTEGYITDMNIAYDLIQAGWFTGRLFLGYKQDGWVWEDSGKYALYPENNYVPIDLGGRHYIRYEQQIAIPYIGASFDAAWHRFTLSGYLTYSPFVHAKDWDDHYSRHLHFEEEFKNGDMYSAGLSARYDFQNGFYIAAAADYQLIDRIIGDMNIYDYDTWEYGFASDTAGLENEYLVFTLGAGLQF